MIHFGERRFLKKAEGLLSKGGVSEYERYQKPDH